VTGAVDEKRLPVSIGGLIDLAFAALAERAWLYLLLSLAVFTVGALVEVALPAAKAGTPQGDLKLLVFIFSSLFVDALATAAVAIGIGTRVAGEMGSSRAIAGAAVNRWPAVIGVSLIVQFVQIVTEPLSAIGGLPDPPALAILTAPLIWVLWGGLSLAAPIAALSTDRPTLAILSSIVRAVAIAFRTPNLARLCLLAFVSVLPSLMQDVATDQLAKHGISRVVFWANIPIDALTVTIVAAIQTVFALDFARRLGRLETPRR